MSIESKVKLDFSKPSNFPNNVENQFKETASQVVYPTFVTKNGATFGDTICKEKNIFPGRMFASSHAGDRLSRVPSPVIYQHPLNECWPTNGRCGTGNAVGFTYAPGYIAPSHHYNGFMAEQDSSKNNFFFVFKYFVLFPGILPR